MRISGSYTAPPPNYDDNIRALSGPLNGTLHYKKLLQQYHTLALLVGHVALRDKIHADVA